MKKSKWLLISIFVLIAILLFVLGFFLKGSLTTGAVTCNAPYILVGGNCCLDKDYNKICDKDEQTVPNTETTGSSIYKPQIAIDSLTVEGCADNQYFSCPYSYVHKDSIEMDFKVEIQGSFVITKLEFSAVPCSQTFEEVPKEQGLQFGDVKKFIVKCDQIKNREYVDTEVKIYMIHYPYDEVLNIYNKKPYETTVKSWVSGIVRN